MALPEDLLLEIFHRLAPPRDIIRCAAVCRCWRRIISSSNFLPAPPLHFGFFRDQGYYGDPGKERLPIFAPTTAGVDLSLGGFILPVASPYGAAIQDCRAGRVLLRDLLQTELALIVADPLQRSSVRLPPLATAPASTLAFLALAQTGPGDAFSVAVVLYAGYRTRCRILVYRSSTDSWEEADAELSQELRGTGDGGQSVVVGDVVYRMRSDKKRIVGVDTAKMTLSVLPLPAPAATNQYQGNHCIGRTAEGRLCFFALGAPILLHTWVLDEPLMVWGPEQPPVSLRPLMSPARLGVVLLGIQFDVSDYNTFTLRFRGFCEGTGTLFFVMEGRLLALHLRTMEMEALWDNCTWLLRQVYPYQMVPWPPALKAFD